MRRGELTSLFSERTSDKFGGWAAGQTFASVRMNHSVFTNVPAMPLERGMSAVTARGEYSS